MAEILLQDMLPLIWVVGLLVVLFLFYLFWTLDCSIGLAFYDTFFRNKHRLKNKTAWIIGASTGMLFWPTTIGYQSLTDWFQFLGIGEEIAYQLAKLQCKLILTSTSAAKLEEVKAECIKRSQNTLKDDDILVLPYDLSNFEESDNAFKKIIEKFGKIDLLVANTARTYISEVTDDDFANIEKVFAVNYFAHVRITKLVLKHWLANWIKVQILVTSAIAANLDFFPFASQYSVSKKIMNCFYRDVAMQHQKNGITVTICLPGKAE